MGRSAVLSHKQLAAYGSLGSVSSRFDSGALREYVEAILEELEDVDEGQRYVDLLLGSGELDAAACAALNAALTSRHYAILGEDPEVTSSIGKRGLQRTAHMLQLMLSRGASGDGIRAV